MVNLYNHLHKSVDSYDTWHTKESSVLNLFPQVTETFLYQLKVFLCVLCGKGSSSCYL